ncbi:unnamed protein product, partial [Medioppia subpectinata]
FICNALSIFTPYGPKRYTNLPTTMAGKVVVITGANSGIGKVNATLFAKLGAKVVMGCRDMAKAYIAAMDIRTEAGADMAKVLVMKLDLSSLVSVREFAKALSDVVDHIDILVNNAAVMFCPNWRTDEGFEMQFGINHLGHFLLTHLVMDKLMAAPDGARIINVSSMAHMIGEINFEDINSDQSYGKYRAYFQSKLANVLFTRELAQRLKGTGVRAYCLHPGNMRSDLYKHLYGFWGLIACFMGPFCFMSAEMGAQTTHFCALDVSVADDSGYYY